MRRTFLIMAVAGILAILPAVAGGAATHHKAQPPPSKAAAGKKLLAVIAVEQAAITKDKAGSNPNFRGISAAFASAAQSIQSIKFPKGDSADVKALVAVLNKLSYDAGQIAKVDLSSAQGLLATVQADEGTEAADSDTLRHDLGLPAAKIP